jgi:hypothetical protein
MLNHGTHCNDELILQSFKKKIRKKKKIRRKIFRFFFIFLHFDPLFRVGIADYFR